jgi:hypothetical protein
MSAIEDRLRDALTERARHSPVHPDAWEQTLARTRPRPRPGGGHGSGGASRIATAPPSLPAPLSQKDYLIQQDPPVSQVVRVKVGTGSQTLWVYIWYARMKGGQGTVLCSEVRSGKFLAGASCETIRLSAHQPGALAGGSVTVMVGASGGQVASVRAHVSGGPAVAGQLGHSPAGPGAGSGSGSLRCHPVSARHRSTSRWGTTAPVTSSGRRPVGDGQALSGARAARSAKAASVAEPGAAQ